MASELRDLMAQLELSLVETVSRLEEALTERQLVDVLDLEERLEAHHDALAFLADSIAAGMPSPVDRRIPPLSRPDPQGGGARGKQDR